MDVHEIDAGNRLKHQHIFVCPCRYCHFTKPDEGFITIVVDLNGSVIKLDAPRCPPAVPEQIRY